MSLLSGDAPRSDGAPPVCSLGPLLITSGAALFACTNAATTAYFRRGGTVVTLYIVRCVILYLVNGALVAAREGRVAAARCLLLRTGRVETTRLVLLRSLNFAVMSLFMCFGYLLLTFSNAFTVMKGVDMLTAVLITRLCMGHSERLSAEELACGSLTLVGITLVARPTFLFRQNPPVDTAEPADADTATGLAVAALAGSLSAGVGVLTRLLSQAGGAHDGHAPPTTLLSCLNVTMLGWFGALALLGHASGLAAHGGPLFAWCRVVPPRDATDWALVGVHCGFTLSAQLVFAAGYRRATRPRPPPPRHAAPFSPLAAWHRAGALVRALPRSCS